MTDHRTGIVAVCCALSVLLLAAVGIVPAGDAPREPFHRRIDRLIEADAIAPPAAIAGDAEFLRRVSLDLTGMPPSVEELRAFLADRRPEKRARAVDAMLADPRFARQWASTLDVMLMERRPSQNVPENEWQAYLIAAARENRSLSAIFADLVRADGTDPRRRGPARFYLDRELDPNLIARDVGRIFFGRDLQCAHCHDHPLVEDYRQTDYYGLLAFFSPGYDPSPPSATKKTAFPERAGTDLTFDSVFVKNDHHMTGPRLPGGPELDEPDFPPGDEYQVRPTAKTLAVPRHGRRAMLAGLVAGGGNRAFNENLANRLWAMMMGRGLVHPLDLGHPANPPSHPELLKMLGDELAALRFDARAFLREIALTRVYQRAIDLPASPSPDPRDLASRLAALKKQSEVLEAAADRDHDAYRRAEKDWHRAEEALIPLAAEVDKAVAKHAEAVKKEDESHAAVVAAEADLAARRDAAKAVAEAAAKAREAAGKLPKEKPLADAAAVFAKRAASLAVEVPAVEKTLADRRLAHEKSRQAVKVAAVAVTAARAKARPVRESVRRQEMLALEARRKNAASRTAQAGHARRVETLEALVRRESLRREAESTRQAIGACRDRLAAARAAVRTPLPLPRANGTPEGFGPAVEQFVAAWGERSRRERAVADALTALQSAEARGRSLATELADAEDDLATALADRFAIAQLRPLSPEQMCWSILRVTGVYDRTAKAAGPELDRVFAIARAFGGVAGATANRPADVEALTFHKLHGNVRPFVSVYGAGAGQPQGDFFATADQALFATNGGSINAWIAPAGGNIADRMVREPDPAKAAEDLYMTVLSRPPTDSERVDAARLLAGPPPRKATVVQELVWGLLTSAEFRFNH
ncbi:MAG: DUF1549 domain-containing protein [Isosphaeraceae bacterium]